MSISQEKSAIHKLAADRLWAIKKLGDQIEQLGVKNKRLEGLLREVIAAEQGCLCQGCDGKRAELRPRIEATLAAGGRHITDRNWQSMSTAPKDGSHILVWTELDEIEVAFWMDGKKHGDLEGYWAYPSQDHFGMQALLWQPLPERPAKAQVRREELVRDRLRDMERKQRRRR